jgi:hypothetical protein
MRRRRMPESRSKVDVSAYTKAAVFQPGTRTDTLIRFSTVAGERGSPDTWRDPRSFALKFYTPEGNYDLVGNNTPIRAGQGLDIRSPAARHLRPSAEVPGWGGGDPARPVCPARARNPRESIGKERKGPPSLSR